MHLKILSAKWRPFRLGGDELIHFGPLRLYGIIKLGQHWFRYWLASQCWLIISEVLWNSPECNATENAQHIYILDISLKIDDLILQAHISGANELRLACVWRAQHLKEHANGWWLLCSYVACGGSFFYPYPAGLLGCHKNNNTITPMTVVAAMKDTWVNKPLNSFWPGKF